MPIRKWSKICICKFILCFIHLYNIKVSLMLTNWTFNSLSLSFGFHKATQDKLDIFGCWIGLGSIVDR